MAVNETSPRKETSSTSCFYNHSEWKIRRQRQRRNSLLQGTPFVILAMMIAASCRQHHHPHHQQRHVVIVAAAFSIQSSVVTFASAFSLQRPSSMSSRHRQRRRYPLSRNLHSSTSSLPVVSSHSYTSRTSRLYSRSSSRLCSSDSSSSDVNGSGTTSTSTTASTGTGSITPTESTVIASTTTSTDDVSSTSHEPKELQQQQHRPLAPKPPKVRRILSGVQPTGVLHLGNYFGAIQQWVNFQNTHCPVVADEHDDDNVDEKSSPTLVSTTPNEEQQQAPQSSIVENYLCVVDLHAMTSMELQTPEELHRHSLMSVALYIAAGIDPQRSKIFIQSHVTAHSELAWLLQCITPVNWIERMIQYKEKAKKNSDGTAQQQQQEGSSSVSTGLMTYPILMAADILLYQATEVPVGEDQRQHLELTRDIVRRFHDLYCTGNAYKKRMQRNNLSTYPVFVEPNAMIASKIIGTSRIMSLTDGTKKMSKSDSNDYSRINLLDPPQLIRDKIKKCKTDMGYNGIDWDSDDNDTNNGSVSSTNNNNNNETKKRPEATNLLNIYAAVQPHRTRDDIRNEVQNMTWGTFKPILAEAIIQHLQPIQDKYHDIMKTASTTTSTDVGGDSGSSDYLNTVLYEGATAANAIASQTLHKVKVAMGFVIPPLPPPSSLTK